MTDSIVRLLVFHGNKTWHRMTLVYMGCYMGHETIDRWKGKGSVDRDKLRGHALTWYIKYSITMNCYKNIGWN